MSVINARSCFGLAISNAFDTVRLFERSGDQKWNTVLRLPKSNLEGKTASEAVALINTNIDQLPFDLETTTHWMLTIPAIGLNGFAIDLTRSSSDQIVGLFGGLEETFDTLPEALSWVERALSNTYCLQIKLRNGQPKEWRLAPVDPMSDGGVLAGGQVGTFSFFQPRNDIVIKQNACFATKA